MSVVAKHWLIESMASRDAKTAMIWNGVEASYDDFVDDVRGWAAELARLRVMPGDSVAICGDYSPSSCALMISLIANRNVVVPLTLPAAARRNDLLRIAQAQASFHFEGDRFTGFARHDAGPEHELLKRSPSKWKDACA